MSKRFNRIVIVGGSSAIAEHCARIWVAQGVEELVLLGRHLERLERVAKDLATRAPATRVVCMLGEFIDPSRIAETVEKLAATGPIDLALVAHGSLPEQKQCESALAECHDALQINGVSPALYAEGLAGAMDRAGRGTLVLLGSVAGDRGRRSNYVYGAAKGLLTRYAQGLQHRFAGTDIKVVLVKPGPTATPMTAHLPADRLARVEDVAEVIVKAAARGQPLVYAPGKWKLIMWVVRHLPDAIFAKMNI